MVLHLDDVGRWLAAPFLPQAFPQLHLDDFALPSSTAVGKERGLLPHDNGKSTKTWMTSKKFKPAADFNGSAGSGECGEGV